MPIFVNLTPHALNVERAGMPNLIIPASGDVARVATNRVSCGTIHPSVTVEMPSFGEVEGLPEQSDDIVYIVSGMVLSAVQHRADVFAPGELVRDESGRVTGCRGLSCTMAFKERVDG